jgi:prolyl-tRNA synthetase
MTRGNDRGVTRQSEDFSAWYNELVLRAELADRGPVRGTMVIRPYGYGIWELLQRELDARIKATGHENAYFPLLIPQSYFTREAEHVEGFAPELAVVTHAGGEELEEPLVVRPTSEAVIGEMFSRWIDSYRDLPLLINQWANVVRWEMRPRLFLRTTEFLWQEGHTAHVDEADATTETLLAAAIYAEVARDIAAMPVLVGDKTERERFAGAKRTVSLEAMMRDGRALQAGTSHYLGTNFATAFNIKFTNATGTEELAHTTSWGMSSRMIGGVIMCHGDDRGLILPPKLAPVEVVIVPIGKPAEITPVLAAAADLASQLRATGVRVKLDNREGASPGFKFNHWELRGVPLRIEIGPRDLAANAVTIADRLSGDKEQLGLMAAAASVRERLEAFQAALFERARRFLDEHTIVTDNYDDFSAAVAQGFALAHFCGEEACEQKIKEDTTATPRVVPFDGNPESGNCIVCGTASGFPTRVVFARAY